MESVASWIRCIQDDRHVMWSMLTGNEVACQSVSHTLCCLYITYPQVSHWIILQTYTSMLAFHCTSTHLSPPIIDSGAISREWCVVSILHYSHCIQDGRRVMWSMLTGNEAACTCLYMHSVGDVGTSKGML